MLKDDQDAYGYEIYDYYQGNEDVFEIVEREDGYIDVSQGPSYYFRTFEDWLQVERDAIKHALGRVLDIGCGAGRIALYLQEAGHDVLGIDISPKAIEVCRLRGLEKTQIFSITQVSSRLGQFDTVVMMGNNFGLFANPKRMKWLLNRFYGMTSLEARIITSSNDIYKTNDSDHLTYHQFNRDRSRMPGQIRIRIRYKKKKTPWFDYLMVSKEEMVELLQGSGWQVTRFIESESPFYIAIIEKAQP